MDIPRARIPPAPEYLLGSPVYPVSIGETVRWCANLIRQRQRGYICITSVHTITEAVFNEPLRRALADGLVVPDGMPLVWFLKLRGHALKRRVYGPDLTLATCREAQKRGWRIFWFGSTPSTLGGLRTALRRKFPRLKIAGMCSPEFKTAFSTANIRDQARDINRTRPDIVMVGLGAPKQEIWMAKARPHLKAPVIMGPGAAFDFIAGTKPQAPRWMMNTGLEWLYRLATEPRRLWSRYLLYIPLFVVLIALQFTGLTEHSRTR